MRPTARQLRSAAWCEVSVLPGALCLAAAAHFWLDKWTKNYVEGYIGLSLIAYAVFSVIEGGYNEGFGFRRATWPKPASRTLHLLDHKWVYVMWLSLEALVGLYAVSSLLYGS